MKQLDLISPTSEDFCCGTTCPRKEVQIRINDMQQAINKACRFINYMMSDEDVAKLRIELKRLSTE